jgi:hypothetical protein
MSFNSLSYFSHVKKHTIQLLMTFIYSKQQNVQRDPQRKVFTLLNFNHPFCGTCKRLGNSEKYGIGPISSVKAAAPAKIIQDTTRPSTRFHPRRMPLVTAATRISGYPVLTQHFTMPSAQAVLDSTLFYILLLNFFFLFLAALPRAPGCMFGSFP